MNNHDVFSNRVPIRALVGGVALALFSLTAGAQTAATASSDAAFGKLLAQVTGTGKQTVGFGTNGTPLVSPGVPQGVPDGGTGFKVTGTGSIVNPSGNPVPVSAVGRVTNATAALAIGKALARVASPIGVAITIGEITALALELGYGLRRDAGGNLVVEKNGNPTTGGYKLSGSVFPYDTSMQAACDRYAAWLAPQVGPVKSATMSGTTCTVVTENTTSTTTPKETTTRTGSIVYTAPAPGNPTAPPTPSTAQALADEIAVKSGWPATSNLAKAAAQAAAVNGEALKVEPGTVTGPSTSTGKTTTETTTNPDGSTKTTTSTTVHNHNYVTNNITTTTTTSSNVTNNGQQGVNTPTTTKTETPELPKDECTEGSLSVKCATFDTPVGDIPKQTKTVTFTEETMFGAGSCPANKAASLGTLGQSVTVWNWTKACEFALPLRALIMALATLGAFMIVLPGSERA